MKVVDLSTDIAGQWASKLFALGGVEVLRPPDPSRPAALAQYLDAFKCRVASFEPSVVHGADLVFTTFDAGRRVGYAAEVELPDDCIEVMTSTFGATGPYASFRGGPLAAWAAGGYLAITGEPAREPIIGPEHLCEYVTGYMAAVAAEAALRERQRTKVGRRIDVGAMESMLLMHQTTYGELARGECRQRTGRYYEVYPLVTRPCRDGYVLLCIVTDEEYDRFLVAIDKVDLLADERFSARAALMEYRDDFDAAIAPFLEAHDAEAIVDILAANGVVAAKVAQAEDVLANPQLASRGFWSQGPGPGNPVPAARVFPVSSAEERSEAPRVLRGRPAQGLPLDGVVVIDFTVYWAGPLATRILADLGARVITVERPHARVDLDLTNVEESALGRHVFHLDLDRHKESVVLDLSTAEGRSVARQLVANADAVVENNRPGVMDNLGLGAAELCTAYPQLVYVSLSGWGSAGPWAQRRSYGPAIEAASSIEGRTGYPGGEPLRLGHPLPDGTGGLAGAYAVLRGLRERGDRGMGGWFDISQLESYVAVSGEDLVNRTHLSRIGNVSRWGVRQGVYPCRGDNEWIALRLVDSADEQAFATATGVDPADDVAITAFTARHLAMDLTGILQRAGIEAFPALKPTDLARDIQLRHRGFLLRVAVGDRSVIIPGSPLYSLADPVGPAPRFGQHTAAVLAELDLACQNPGGHDAALERK
jgi:crotonobetainyl-CoA:carnitine CoA-transferase CaiB-like acyl-CoA transferase